MKIHIPTPLRAYTDKQDTVEVAGTTLAAGLQGLVETYPALKQHLFTPEGKLRSFVNVYVGDEDMRYLPEKEDTPVVARGFEPTLRRTRSSHASSRWRSRPLPPGSRADDLLYPIHVGWHLLDQS